MRNGIFWVVGLFGFGALMGDTARIGAVLLDAETRRPLEGVEMTASFEMDNGWQAWKGAASPNRVKVRTDREGRCRAAARTNKGSAGWFVGTLPAGYYAPSTGGWWRFERKDPLGVWQPSDVVSTVLVERVGRPVPLVGRRVHDDIVEPARADLVGKAGGRLAYDFLRGDWLPPVGRGETADVVFVRGAPEELGTGVDAENEREGRAYRQRLTMRFPGKDNGIVELAPPAGRVPKVRTAPEGGYGPGLDFEAGVDKTLQDVRKDHSGKTFAFRIRARRDAEGRLVEAYYGKIYGGIEVVDARGAREGTWEKLGEPRFLYLLNPAPLDRNLEWDMETLLGWNRESGRLEPVDRSGPRIPGHLRLGREP